MKYMAGDGHKNVPGFSKTNNFSPSHDRNGLALR